MNIQKNDIIIYLLVVLAATLLLSPSISTGGVGESDNCSKSLKLSDEATKLAATDLPAAATKLREAVACCAGSAALRYNLAVTLYKMGSTAEAEAALEEVIRINPDHGKALNNLANILYSKPDGNKARAEHLAGRAVKLDPANKKFQSTFELIAGNIEQAPRTNAYLPDAIAVIIGNGKYSNPQVPEVKYAYQDMASVKSYMIQTFGIPKENIIEIKDASLGEFIKIFGTENDHQGQLYNRVKKDVSKIFIYYAGHGAPDLNNHKAYLVPVDADPSIIRLQGYALDTLYANLEKLQAEKNPKNITVAIDACFSGGSGSTTLFPQVSSITLKVVPPVLNLKNTVVFVSSKSDQVSSWYPEKNHSLFTYFFLKSIKTSVEESRKLTAADIEKNLLGGNSVNDFAWRMYNREQQPQVIGDTSITYLQ
ncbi:MAG: hypothetical protein A2511_03970 [Deltaproteobacteria bacterium RIFOXYD12_FULL_50_9]|nr:MAG: hypothetical protein A2511_03970 [Deltaproteobacteria bacterium RIFOXYD12_FULL_50_9]